MREATFIERPNRFVAVCDLGGRRVRAYLPNPGKLWEILLPGTRVRLEEADGANRKLAYTVVAAERLGRPVLLHTHRNNDVAARMLERGMVPGLEGARVVAREVTRGRSRFDFLLEESGREILLEVKSCTLFSREVAMFPDAVSVRASRHLEELAEFARGRTRCAVLFVIHSPGVKAFLPEYHRDLAFAQTLLAVRRKVRVIPLAVSWNGDGVEVDGRPRPVDVPWDVLEGEAQDRGCYLIILRLKRRRAIEVGKLGRIRFEPGYYVYVGSAMRSLSRRIERHRRLRKKMHWHIDYLRAVADWHEAVPILASDDLECEVAAALRSLVARGSHSAGQRAVKNKRVTAKILDSWSGSVEGFGASDCGCPSHLFFSASDPILSREFQDMLEYFRMDRLLQLSR
jgi:sugar fermentation stimulation protein A